MAQVLPVKRHSHTPSLDGLARPSRAKRPRYSAEPSIEPSDISPSRENSEASSDDEDTTAPAMTEANDEDFMRATQIVQKSYQKAKHGQNEAAECGIIEEIGCMNFMCHERLTVKLGPLINFIIGHNGSGKSAVLTALTLCLGAKASSTNRGQSLKSFIKNGQESATLSVKIKNQGPGAWKPEQYGDSIIVERHFTRAGASSFKLKDRNGRIVSTKKAELEDITDCFAMQIDNPLNVLTQDMARQFLNDSSPKDKYKFFLKGTQLETLDRDYQQIQRELEEQISKALTLQKDVEAHEAQYRKLEKRSQRARGLQKLRDEERDIEKQKAWAYVVAEEEAAAKMENEISKLSGIIDQKKADGDVASEEFTRADEELNHATRALAERQAELQTAKDDENEARASVVEATSKLNELKSNERQLVGSVQTHKQLRENTQSQIEEQKERRARADGGLHEQKLRELDEATTMFEQRKNAWETHDQNLPALNKDLQDAKDRANRLRTQCEEKRNEETQSKGRIRNLEQGQSNWVNAYGPTMERLMREIAQERRFREPPVGPLGRYVELKHPQWSSVLEKSFGATLNGFVVTNKADQSILSGIMKRLRHNAPVFIGPRHHISTSGNEPDGSLLTWLRALNITNDAVRNALVINHGIEQTVLIQKRQEASDFAHRLVRERTARDAKVRLVYCWSDTGRRTGHSLSLGDGSVGFGPINAYEGTPRMHADKGPQIQDEKENLARIQGELHNLVQRLKASEEYVKACEAKLHNHKREKVKLKAQMDRAHDDMDTLEGEVAMSVPDTAQLEQLEKELEDYENKVKLDEEQLQDLIQSLEDAKTESRNQKRALHEATEEVQRLQAKLGESRSEALTLTHERERALHRKNKALEEVQRFEENRAEWQQSRDELQSSLDANIEEAEKVCPRVDVPPGATYDSLSKKLEARRQKRAQLERDLGGSQMELAERAKEAKKTWQDADEYVKSTNVLRNGLSHALDTRKDRWHKFRESIALIARVTFQHLLSERRFRGDLSINHHIKALEMQIQPDITVKGKAARQTKTLSGGEKSFSTICLLLALWDAMGSPIRCLDEFDVFMDSVNRDISMGLIIDAARNATGRQYILITPQGMTNKNVGSMSDVTVVRMQDPERGQTSLNFAR